MKQGMGDDKKAENKSYYKNRGINVSYFRIS